MRHYTEGNLIQLDKLHSTNIDSSDRYFQDFDSDNESNFPTGTKLIVKPDIMRLHMVAKMKEQVKKLKLENTPSNLLKKIRSNVKPRKYRNILSISPAENVLENILDFGEYNDGNYNYKTDSIITGIESDQDLNSFKNADSFLRFSHKKFIKTKLPISCLINIFNCMKKIT